jgi:hypothetical protein
MQAANASVDPRMVRSRTGHDAGLCRQPADSGTRQVHATAAVRIRAFLTLAAAKGGLDVAVDPQDALMLARHR